MSSQIGVTEHGDKVFCSHAVGASICRHCSGYDALATRVAELESHAMAAAAFVRKLEGALQRIVEETLEWDRSLHARVLMLLESRSVQLPPTPSVSDGQKET